MLCVLRVNLSGHVELAVWVKWIWSRGICIGKLNAAKTHADDGERASNVEDGHDH